MMKTPIPLRAVLLALVILGSADAFCGGFPEPTGFYVARAIPPAVPHKRIIIFVNGIFGDAKGTWTNSDSSAYWPDMLAKTEPFKSTADIYVYSFNSPVLGSAEDINELAGRMQAYLSDVIGNYDQVIFLCHSMGGLVTRRFLIRGKIPGSKIGFIYFYATPTMGASVSRIAAHFPGVNPQLKDMIPISDSKFLDQLRDDWEDTYNDRTLNYPNSFGSYCAYETAKMYYLLFRVVEKESATELCNRPYRAVDANHLEIVKPRSSDAEAFKYFKEAYEDLAPAPSGRSLFRGALRRTQPAEPIATHLAVGCGVSFRSEITNKVRHKRGYRVQKASAEITKKENLVRSFVAVERLNGNTVTTGYLMSAAGTPQINCPAATMDVTVHPMMVYQPTILDRFLHFLGF